MLIKTLQKISMPAGVRLRLSNEQYDRRQYVVGRDADGVSLVTMPLEFKAGEWVDIKGEVPRSIPEEFYEVLDDRVEVEIKEHPGTGEVMTPVAAVKPKVKKTAKAVKAAAVDDVK